MATTWPGSELILGAAPTLSAGAKVTMLGSPEELQWETNPGGGIKIAVPRPEQNPSKWAWTFEINL